MSQFMQDYEWLPQARMLPQGTTKSRADHKCGSTPSMQIGHTATEYWAYCHRCHKRGKQTKEYVMLQGTKHVPVTTNLPPRLIPLRDADAPVERYIRAFLVAQGVNASVQKRIPMFVAVDRDGLHRHERVYIQTPQGFISRAVHRNSTPKVMNHRSEGRLAQTYAALQCAFAESTGTIVITEDILSMYKVQWATQGHVMAALGTRLSPAATYALLYSGYSNVVLALDGDEAGRTGALKMRQNLDALGFNVTVSTLEEDLDPKDLHKHELLSILGIKSTPVSS